jgi:hypothetical protein
MRYDADFVPAQRSLAEPYGFDCYEAALRSWIATVAIVEVGYVGEWEEYAAELSARDYLGELMNRSPGSRSAVEADLHLWDERFRAATIEEAKPHLPPLEGDPGWWQFRSPRQWRKPATEELEALRARKTVK